MPIPAPTEQMLLETLKQYSPINSHDLATVRQGLGVRHAYSLMIFAVRMAIHGARTGSADVIRMGMLGLAVDDGVVDWRDVLIALSLVEDCASRLGLDFGEEIEKLASLATEERKRIMLEGYLPRSSEMRAIDVMGFKATEGSEGLQYVRLR